MASSTFFDRVKVGVASAPGTGVISLGSATPGFRSFVGAGVPDGALVSYVIEDAANFEVGQGTYAASANTLSRTTIYVSSASDGKSAITASASASVYITVTAADLLAIATAAGNTAAAAAGPPPSVVQHAVAGNGSNPPVVPLTVAPTSGNVLVAFVQAIGTTITPASGWLLVSQQVSGRATAILIKQASASDASSANVSPTTTANCYVEVYEVKGALASDASGATTPAFTNPAFFPASTTLTETFAKVPANTLVLGYLAYSSGDAPVLTSSGLSLDDTARGGLGDYAAMYSFHKINATLADLTITANLSFSAPAQVMMVALAPAASTASAGSTASTTPAAPTYTTAYTTYLIQFTALGPKKPDYMSFAEISMVDKNGNKQTPSSIFSNEGPFNGNNGYGIANAIDGDLTTFYASADANLPQSVALTYPTAFVAGGVRITCRNGDDYVDQTPTALMVSGSNDGGSSYAAASGALTLPAFSSASQVQTATIS